MKKLIKGIIYVSITSILVFMSYNIGRDRGAVYANDEIVGKLRQNCVEGKFFTSLDKTWKLRCEKM